MIESIPNSVSGIPHSLVADTFAEAFPMTAARAIVTADTPDWAEIAGRTMTGYATSVIACDAEAAIERVLEPDETPDGRPGVSVLVFAFSRDALEKALVEPRRPVRDDLPDDGLLQRAAGRREDDQRRRPAPLLRRRLADLQAARRAAVLADPGDGRRVHSARRPSARSREWPAATSSCWGPSPRRRSQRPRRPSRRCGSAPM